ncbi:MarR family transcriptional regulator [Nocardia sp. NBC_01730]|uniref:MarR family transcriptional regulator n=1 Tax=Nocardia sp. NBC_01730 TaxID=2975998 RepID=UPI002E1108BE|nr:MarR family transcriptional regulator [Nocardia sp. NBC_01730]
MQATRTVMFHSTVAARLGITLTDLSCLNILGVDGPQTPGRLADRIGITRGGAVTALIDRLERAGYVRRERDPDDRRRVLVALDEASATVAPLFSGLGTAISEHLDGYDTAEIELLTRFVAGVNGRVAQATDRLRSAQTP